MKEKNKQKKTKKDGQHNVNLDLSCTSAKRSNKGVETSTIIDKHNGLSEFDIVETEKEDKKEKKNIDRFKVFVDDTVAEENSENEM